MTEKNMIIKDKQQAADQGTHGPILLAAWEAGETRVVVGGKEYELVSEPEPVAMYTEEELDILMMSLAKTGVPVGSGVRFRDLILARRAETLRAMGDNRLLGELERAYEDFYPGPANGDGISAVCALVREHIEANRPGLTEEIVSGWYDEFCKKSARRFSVDDACQYVAHRAAEYRSNTDALRVKHGSACAAEVKELRAENERLNAQCERLVAGTYSEGDLVTQRDDANLILAAENLELRTENERLKKDREDGCADYLTLRDISDGHEVECHKLRAKLAFTNKEIEQLRRDNLELLNSCPKIWTITPES